MEIDLENLVPMPAESTPKGVKKSKKESLAPTNLAPGDASRIVTQMMAIRSIGSRADVNDPVSLRNCFYEYVQLCMNYDIRVTNLSACAACGITQTQLKLWRDGKTRANDPRYRELAEEIFGFCAEYREMMMNEGKINPVVGIWWQKVYDKYTDLPQPQAADSTLGEVKSAAEIAEKYQNLPD